MAEIAKKRMHSAVYASDGRRCAPPDPEPRGSLQLGATASAMLTDSPWHVSVRKADIRYDPAINSAPSAAKAASSSDERPLTATAPTTSPFFQTGIPPPQPTYCGS